MIRYRQEHCGMVLMLLPIRYLLLSTRSLISDSVPAAWKLAETCPISQKDNPHNKSNYRLVSTLVTLDKAFEYCPARKLSDYFRSILSPFLFANR